MSMRSGTPPSESSLSSTAQSTTFRRYLAPFLILPLLMMGSAFFIVPSHWLAMRAGNLYLANIGYGAQIRNHDCQVLIYGDSAAMVGVDPAAVRKATGLSVCNIAEFEGMTVVNRTMTLDIFLRQNRQPRFLIFLYAPEDLNRGSWTRHPTFEAISFRLQQGPSLETAALLTAHPNETFSWAEDGLRLALAHFHSAPYSFQSSHLRDAVDGQFKVPGPALSGCDASRPRLVPQADWIAELRTRYARPGTTVLVDAVPTPDCDPVNPWYDESLRGAVDNEPMPHFPIFAYTTGGLHTNELGSRMLSDMVANQVKQAQNHGPSVQSASLHPPTLPTSAR